MDSFVLITSVINTPNTPLSYTNTRSVFSRQDRFEQTKKTIKSVREKLSNSKIIIVECSDFNEEERKYFKDNCDYILNLWNKKELHNYIFGQSKSLGEGTMTIEALKYIEEFNLDERQRISEEGGYYPRPND